MTAGRAVLDTSVWIAAESGRRIDVSGLPDEAAVSVITVAELEAGVLAAKDVSARAARLATVNGLSDIELLPIDAPVARMWARMRVELAERGGRINVNDLWIAATAASLGLPVVTQDDDFRAVEGIAGLEIWRV